MVSLYFFTKETLNNLSIEGARSVILRLERDYYSAAAEVDGLKQELFHAKMVAEKLQQENADLKRGSEREPSKDDVIKLLSKLVIDHQNKADAITAAVYALKDLGR